MRYVRYGLSIFAVCFQLTALPFYKTTLAQTSTTVQGRVIVGTTTSDPLPEGFQLELQIIDADSVQTTATFTTTIEADGSFAFNNVPSVQGNDFYLIYATYSGLRQNSQPFGLNQVDNVLFYLYETTDQLDDIVISSGVMQIEEFSFLQGSGVNIEVVLELVIENRGDKILYNGDTAFTFELVVGAYGYSEVTTEASTATYLRFEDGLIPVVKDTIPLIPDWPARTIRVSFLLEYYEGAIIDLRFPVPAENFEVLVPIDTVELTSDTLRSTGEEHPGIGSNITYRLYRQLNTIQPDEGLIFALEGRPTETITNDPVKTLRDSRAEEEGASSTTLFGGFFGIMFIFGGAWWVWRRRRLSLAEKQKGENSELS